MVSLVKPSPHPRHQTLPIVAHFLAKAEALQLGSSGAFLQERNLFGQKLVLPLHEFQILD